MVFTEVALDYEAKQLLFQLDKIILFARTFSMRRQSAEMFLHSALTANLVGGRPTLRLHLKSTI